MTDAVHNFATLCATAIRDIAAGTLVDALASLEHSLPSLHREQRYAGQAVARALWRLAGGHPVSTREPVEEALYMGRCAAWWSQLTPTRRTLAEVGKSLERGRVVVGLMDATTCRHMQQLLRAVLSEVERVALNESRVSHVAA